MIFVERDAGKVKGRSTHSWMNRTNNGCLAKGEGTFKKLRVPGKNRIHHLRNPERCLPPPTEL